MITDINNNKPKQYYNHLFKSLIKYNQLPSYFIFYPTSRCNLKCSHCFYHDSLNKKFNELTLEELEKITKSMDPILHLILTGGEPFLRHDLHKIVKIFYENTKVPILTIPSNGWYTEKMETQINYMMESCKKITLNQQISIDGIGKDHDFIRMDKQVKDGENSFEKAIKTIHMLKRLQKKYERINIGIIATFTEQNQNKFKDIKISEAINHPNWKMGKKISVDSATMMNKVFEIIEAKKIFNIKYEALDILVHPSSYVHAIIKFNDGMVKIIAHDTNMRIPIFNSLYENQNKKIKTDKLNLKKLNLLNLKKVDLNKFPSIKIIKKLKNKESSLETVIVLANDILVNHFLLKKIYFTDITKFLQKLISMKKFKNYSNNKLDNINSIVLLNNQIRTTINKMIT